MRMFLIWFLAILITLIMISPFFWLWFLRKSNKVLYILSSFFISISIFLLYFNWGDDILDNFFRKYNTNLLYLYNTADVYSVITYLLLLIFSPFIFTKIIHRKITVKLFFVLLLLSIIIFVAFFLIFAYYIFPKAAEGFLINI